MKRFSSICSILLLAGLFVMAQVAAVAQSVKLKRVAIELNERPKGTAWSPSNGLRVVGIGSKVYYFADTTGSGSHAVTALIWTFNGRPAGSNAAFDSTGTSNSFTPDSVGLYSVQVDVGGGKTARDSVFASTYIGTYKGGRYNVGCGDCHGPNFTSWQGTGHAKIFSEGVSGNLEVDAGLGKGAYGPGCIKCHTTGWDPNANNGNFGFMAHQSGWDTSWYKPLTYTAGDYWVTTNDSSILHGLGNLAPTGAIGCETCHGPGGDHFGEKSKIDVSLNAGVCNICHNGSGHHNIGYFYNRSNHATFPNTSHANSTGCFPCHSGSSLVKQLDGETADASDILQPVSCAVCHDPHNASNEHQLRTVAVPAMVDGFQSPLATSASAVCMNCHHSRVNIKGLITTSNPPLYGFSDRFGPHHGPQSDMFLGTNGSMDQSLQGLTTHTQLEAGCATCHMQDRVAGGTANHGWSMDDTTGGFDATTVCRDCHGSEVRSFDDVKGFYDYDGNGRIEGIQTEIAGLLEKLRLSLPLDSTGSQPYQPISRLRNAADSAKAIAAFNGHPEVVSKIYTYYFIVEDKSIGIHNPKYAIALLQKALGLYPLEVKPANKEIPTSFALNQNYPNPFNPTTTISFALPQRASVKLEVYDVLGRLINTLVNQDMGAGKWSVTWNGNDQNGARVASGMYLYRLSAGEFNSVKKMLMIK